MPIWAHFSITRVKHLPRRVEETPNIAGLNAFVSPFSESDYETSGYTHTIKLILGLIALPGDSKEGARLPLATPAATSQEEVGKRKALWHQRGRAFLGDAGQGGRTYLARVVRPNSRPRNSYANEETSFLS